MEDLQLWFEISRLQDRYLSTLDNDRLEEWPDLFTDDCVYEIDADTVESESSYVVIQTRTEGDSFVFQAGRYVDRVVRTPVGWRYASKRVIYDTSRVQTLLATPGFRRMTRSASACTMAEHLHRGARRSVPRLLLSRCRARTLLFRSRLYDPSSPQDLGTAQAE